MQSERRGFLAAIGALFAGCFAWAIPKAACGKDQPFGQQLRKTDLKLQELEYFVADNPTMFTLAKAVDEKEWPRLKEAMLKLCGKVNGDEFRGYGPGKLFFIGAHGGVYESEDQTRNSIWPAKHGYIESYIDVLVLENGIDVTKKDSIFLGGKFNIDAILAARVVPGFHSMKTYRLNSNFEYEVV